MKIILAGGSGHLGQLLAAAFVREGSDVVVLTRSGRCAHGRAMAWDSRTLGGWAGEVDGADAVINLAGRSVDCRYSAVNRAEIISSRVDSTRVVGEAIARAARPPRVWLNASSATIYRHAFDRAMDEATGEVGGSEPGTPEKWRFSIDVIKQWEGALDAAATPATRRVALRISIVMSKTGGALPVLLRLTRFGLGGANGDGRQFVSWIHETDLVRAVQFLLAREDISGPVNLAAPNPLPNREFMRAIRRAAGVPFGLPAPAPILEIGTFLMRTESELVLKSRRVVPGKLLAAGFKFQFEDWDAAARDLV